MPTIVSYFGINAFTFKEIREPREVMFNNTLIGVREEPDVAEKERVIVGIAYIWLSS